MTENTSGVDIKIAPNVDPCEVDQRIHEAVAKKAFQIFERRGRTAGQERQDWTLAESKVVRPLCCGVLETENVVDVAIDLGRFDLHSGIEIVTEPRRLIVSGSERPAKERGNKGSKKLPSQVFGIVELPATVDATKIESNLKGHVLEVRIPKAVQPEPSYCGQVESPA